MNRDFGHQQFEGVSGLSIKTAKAGDNPVILRNKNFDALDKNGYKNLKKKIPEKGFKFARKSSKDFVGSRADIS